MFDRQTIDDIAAEAKKLGLEPATLLAVADVESGGKAFAMIGGKPEPLIRFEGHYFDKRLSGDRKLQARAAGLASPLAGGVANPRSQAARWALLARAAAIDHAAAHDSVSWGIGQVMGAHWSWLGYQSVDALVGEARSGVAGQVRLMARFIDRSGLGAALAAHDWHAFARGYNGPQYKRHAYHTKLAEAFRRHAESGRGRAVPPDAAQPEARETATQPASAAAGPDRPRLLDRVMSALSAHARR